MNPLVARDLRWLDHYGWTRVRGHAWRWQRGELVLWWREGVWRCRGVVRKEDLEITIVASSTQAHGALLRYLAAAAPRIEGQQSMSVIEAAEKWGVSRARVRQWIAQGRVEFKRNGWKWEVLSLERPAPRKGGHWAHKGARDESDR